MVLTLLFWELVLWCGKKLAKNMKKIYFFIIVIFAACQTTEKQLIDYVNPFIGTGGHGHTYPGAASPFGLLQLSPDS